MATVSLPFDESVDLIMTGIKVEFRRALSARLAEVAQEEVEKLAREVAASVVTQVASYRNLENDKYQLMVTFNTK